MRRSATFLVLFACAVACAPCLHAATDAGALRAAFARPEQTIEYHFMLALPVVPEDSLASAFAARIAAPLAAVAVAGPPGECETSAYVDSRIRGLLRHHLIVRVRERHVTVKARATRLDHLRDLPACTNRKYEVDEFGSTEYSISSDLKFEPRDEVRPFTGDPARVWAWIARDCPELWRRIAPVVAGAGACTLPGIARSYSAPVTLRHAHAALAREAGVTVWYFPPTGGTLAELSFTGAQRDRDALAAMSRDVRASLAAAHLLRADQSSKTEQYFRAYAHTAAGPGL